ncbi:hypothetical protein [Nostoc sp.]|uniref:hypothetical protein n=1 Tax=Nostoc sp. TaxID=1180 RepID=UPI002FFBEE25
MNGKLFKYLGLPCALIMLGNTSALADDVTGTIVDYHINSGNLNSGNPIEQRGVCLQMNPTSPTVNGWVCLWKDNASYKEITDLLLEAYSSRKTCSITYSYSKPSITSLAVIDYVHCYN